MIWHGSHQALSVVSAMEEGFHIDALDGLAESWERSPRLRQRFRDEEALLKWPSPSQVGVPSMFLASCCCFFLSLKP